jgi:flagellar biosynthesis protein FlhA
MDTTLPRFPSFDWRALLGSKDAVLVVSLVLILVLLVVPLPTLIVDLLVAANLALSIGILLLATYIKQPMEFSAFPSVLLLVTLLRLGISIAASRLILLNGDAGRVIETFGDFVVGGNYVVGVVVFIILMIIQFVVITNGSGRVAEVSARFTLDAMPGKQLSIDADLNAGLIDEGQARQRRQAIQSEADFYGAMDGSSKFVRGDATAAIIITVVNVLGGFGIGMLQRGMSLTEALQAYTLMTVGAGLITQIPALLISTAAGLIVTRSTSEQSLGANLVGQLANASVLTIVAVMIGALGLVPGMPTVPFLVVGIGLGGIAYAVWRAQKQAELAPAGEAAATPALEGPEEVQALLIVDPLELEIGYALIPLVGEDRAENLLKRVTSIRKQVATEFGVVLPKVRIRDNLRLQPQQYRIKVRGEEVAKGDLLLDRHLAILGPDGAEQLPGIATQDPAFGLPAVWIADTDRPRAELLGCVVVDALTVMGTHLTEVVRAQMTNLLGRQEVQELLERVKKETPAVAEGLVPDLLTLGEVQDVLRNLLRERVPIRDLATIFEVLANSARVTRDPDVLAEAVRQTLARTLSNLYRGQDGKVHVITLAPQLETDLRAALGPAERGFGFQIDAATAQTIITNTGAAMEQLAQLGHPPVLLVPRELRLAFRRLIDRSLPNLAVMAFSEVSSGTPVQAHGMIE